VILDFQLPIFDWGETMNKKIAAFLSVAMFLASLQMAHAQQTKKLARIGFLYPGPAAPLKVRSEAFLERLRELGYVEGQNVAIEYRRAEGKTEHLPALAAELVQRKADAIVTVGDPAIHAVQQATKTIPIVGVTDDLVGAGLVASLARPGGNTTGVSILSSELNVKRLELLKEAIPRVSRVAALWDPGTGTFHLKALEGAGRALGVQLQFLEVRRPEDLPRAFEAAKNGRAEALNVLASPLLQAYNETIIDLAAKKRLPAIYQFRESAEAGGLMSYGPHLLEVFRQAATYVDKILKGRKPADLPVEQPIKFEFIINLKAAKQIGLTIPPNVLVRADKVIK